MLQRRAHLLEGERRVPELDEFGSKCVRELRGEGVWRIDGAPLVYNQADTYLPDLLICRREWATRVLDAVAAIEA